MPTKEGLFLEEAGGAALIEVLWSIASPQEGKE
jgi:hypothetical protein